MKESEILKFFCNHLIGICFNCTVKGARPDRLHQWLVWSATYIEIDERHYLLTAGHCVAEFEDHRSKGLIEGYTSYLIDTFGSSVSNSQPIPFDYDGAPKFFIDNAELDYGLIEIRETFKKLLAANGIAPITEEHWTNQKRIAYKGHALLGIPVENTQSASISGNGLAATLKPTLVFLRPARQLGDNTLPDEKFTAFVPEDPNLDSIKGMSGGPLIGFAEHNGFRYWIMAIQSSWKADTRQLYACRVPDIVKHYRTQQNAI